MGNRPSLLHSIERADNDKGYFAENCVWATKKEQANNQRTNRILEHEGQRKTVALWADEKGISSGAISKRIAMGWSITDALTKKTKPRRIAGGTLKSVNHHVPC